MSSGRTLSVSILGIEGQLIDVEAVLEPGLPGFTLIGKPDGFVHELRDRVRAAIVNSGFTLPVGQSITVTISAPATSTPGTGFDLAVGVSLLAATGVISPERASRFVQLGELGLDGRVRPVRAVFPAVLAAVRGGRADVVVAVQNEVEARLVPGARVWPVQHLQDVTALLNATPAYPAPEGILEPPPRGTAPEGPPQGRPGDADLADVVGHPEERRALEVAAAGGHHLLMVSAPLGGAVMLAHRLPSLLPDLDDGQALEVTAVHSVAGALHPAEGLIRRPPFESPHHTWTTAAIVGGGRGFPRPGAAALAHRGVLFLDEAPEYHADVLNALRLAMEEGELAVHRFGGAIRFPARFQLIMTARPCPCGRGPGPACTCPPIVRRRYLHRLPRPVLDCIDQLITVQDPSPATDPPESSATVAARVAQARAAQRERLAGTPWTYNGEVPGSWLRETGKLRPSVTRDADVALDRAHLSEQGYLQVLRVAWTIADLAGRSRPQRDDVVAALLGRGTELTW